MNEQWNIERASSYEWVRRLNNGATRPGLVAAEWEGNTETVYLKFREPGRQLGSNGPISLACELVNAAIASRLGLPTPRFGIVDVPDQLAEDQRDWATRDLLAANVGPNFGTVAIPGALNFTPSAQILPPFQLLADVLAFDISVHNKDRACGHPNLLTHDAEIYLIDHGLCPPMKALLDGADPERVHMTPREAREHTVRGVIQGKPVKALALLDRWDAVVNPTSMNSLRAQIPAEWDAPEGSLDLLFSFLLERHNLFRATLSRVIEEVVR